MFIFFVKKLTFDDETEHAPAMLADTHTQRVLHLAHQKGLLRASDLDTIDAPSGSF